MQANLVVQTSRMQVQRSTLVILRVVSYMCLYPIHAIVREWRSRLQQKTITLSALRLSSDSFLT